MCDAWRFAMDSFNELIPAWLLCGGAVCESGVGSKWEAVAYGEFRSVCAQPLEPCATVICRQSCNPLTSNPRRRRRLPLPRTNQF